MEKIKTDVLIIGAGAAGIRAALAAYDEGVDVVLGAKGKLGRSGSTFSPISRGWGIQGLMAGERTDQNLETFYHDIIRVGLGRCDPKLVRILVEESGDRIKELIDWRIRFKKNPDGSFMRAKGCFSSHERAFITEDMQNRVASFRSVLNKASINPFICHIGGLIVNDEVCHGALGVMETGTFVCIQAGAAILATGGGTAIYQDHLVGSDQVGEGYALAHQAGAEFTNMEFIQFMLGLMPEEVSLHLPRQVSDRDDSTIVMFLDEFQNTRLPQYDFDIVGWMQEAVESPTCPHFVTGSAMSIPAREILGRGALFGRFDSDPIDPMTEYWGAEPAIKAGCYYGAEIEPEMGPVLANRCGGNPFYTTAVLRQAAKQKQKIESEKALNENLAVDLSSGFIWGELSDQVNRWIERINQSGITKSVLYLSALEEEG